MEIERANLGDANEILALQKLAYQSEAQIYNNFNIEPLTQTLDALKAEFRAKVFLKAVHEGKIVGSGRAWEKGGTCYIDRLVVHPDQQGKGLGTRLMDAVEDHFASARRYEIFTGYRSQRNIAIYERRGYRMYKIEQAAEDLAYIHMEKLIPVAPPAFRRQVQASVRLGVADLARSRRFYERGLGFKVHREESQGTLVVRSAATPWEEDRWELVLESRGQASQAPGAKGSPARAPTAPGPGITITFFVPDVDERFQAALAYGGTRVAEPAESPQGRAATLRDPDGHSLTLLRPKPV